MRHTKILPAMTATLLLMCLEAGAQGLSLDDCLRRARENYPAVRQYGLMELARDYDLSNASKAWLPQIGVSAGAYAFTDIIDGDNLKQLGVDMDNYVLNASLSISQNIYDGGQTRANKRLIKAEAEVDARQMDVELYDIEDRVQQIFFGILLIDEQLSQNALLQEDLDLSLKTVESMMKGGIANPSDLDAVRAEQVGARQQEQALKSSRKAFARMLSLFVGEELSNEVVLDRPAPTPPLKGDYSGRPEISLFKAQEDVLDERRSQLNARLRPTLGAFAMATTHTSVTDLMNNNLLIGGLSLSWNIGALYTRKADLRRLETGRLSIDAQRSTFIFNNTLLQRDADGAIESLEKQIALDAELVALRESIRSKSELKAQAGTESVNDMLADVIAVSQARQQKALHEVQLLKEQYSLSHITGSQR